MTDNIRTGRCLCGAVRYTVTGPVTSPQICHCRECQRQSGHAWASVSARLKDVALDEDESLAWYRASSRARRGFCRDCGSFLFWQAVGGDRIDLSLGSLDDRDGLALEAEIFCSERAAYTEAAGRVTAHARGSDEPEIAGD